VGLPEYEAFKNTLDPSKTLTEKEYKEAKRLFKELGFVLFKDWHEYYLRGDVLLLADAFTGY
jgi:alpha-ketoglutarate-dependent taurine dioxygenase